MSSGSAYGPAWVVLSHQSDDVNMDLFYELTSIAPDNGETVKVCFRLGLGEQSRIRLQVEMGLSGTS